MSPYDQVNGLQTPPNSLLFIPQRDASTPARIRMYIAKLVCCLFGPVKSIDGPAINPASKDRHPAVLKQNKKRSSTQTDHEHLPPVPTHCSNNFVHRNICSCKRSQKYPISQRLLQRHNHSLLIRENPRLSGNESAKNNQVINKVEVRIGLEKPVRPNLAEDLKDMRLFRRTRTENSASPPFRPAPIAKPLAAASRHRRSRLHSSGTRRRPGGSDLRQLPSRVPWACSPLAICTFAGATTPSSEAVRDMRGEEGEVE
ncbi:hypothetical protein GW17_00031896 [Ensete ventricosum]|nr:hypothetical protein GW17_00031896 [Ensete ventricosum]